MLRLLLPPLLHWVVDARWIGKELRGDRHTTLPDHTATSYAAGSLIKHFAE